MVSTGIVDEPINQGYDIVSTVMLVANLLVSILDTFEQYHLTYGSFFHAVEAVTVFFFGIDFFLRLITASELYPDSRIQVAMLKYIFSFYGIVDLLSFLPYYLPVFFPGGMAAFRMIRVVRILRLFRINAYYDSLNVISDVIVSKKKQLLACVFIITTLMIASSLCMYSVEHEAQPDVFQNAFSGIWWSASTLLTVGYGDIYPVTTMGKVLGVVIAFLGVGIVAIPTGIISAGFVEHYARLKRFGDYSVENNISFIELMVTESDQWCGKTISELGLPNGAIIAIVLRNKLRLFPKADLKLEHMDRLIIGTEHTSDKQKINFTEITLGHNHPWNGYAIKNLDISRDSIIIMIKRREKTKIPRPDMILAEGDTLYIYSQLDSDDGS